MITAAQCRAARGLTNWTQDDLAKAAKVGIVTVRQFEAGNAEPRNSTLAVISQAFEAAGIEFIPENGGGAGVRLRSPTHLRQGADDTTAADLRQGAAILRKQKAAFGSGIEPDLLADSLEREADIRERRALDADDKI